MAWNFIKRADCIYQYQPTGAFYERISRNGKNSWRKLNAVNLKLAREEMAARRTDYHRSKLGLVPDPYFPPRSIGRLAKPYEDAACPNRKRRPREGKSLYQEKNRLKHLLTFWAKIQSDEITRETIEAYADYRFAQRRNGHGSRAVDLELHTLNNVLQWATRRGLIKYNPLKIIEWDSFWERNKTRNARDVMPLSGREVHRLALAFFEGRTHSQVLGWMTLFAALTGLRTNELLRLRTDGTLIDHPGYVDDGHLYLARSKKGVNPWVVLTPEIRACIEAHRKWKAKRCPNSPWWFPSIKHDGREALDISAFEKGCKRISAFVLGHQVTPHGLRAFYVTCRRSQGLRDEQIAAEIGDKTVALISTTYGAVPPNWKGGKELTWLPIADEKGHTPAPAWTVFLEKLKKSPSKRASKKEPSDSEPSKSLGKMVRPSGNDPLTF